MIVTAMLAMALLARPAKKPPETPDRLLIGNWQCVAACPDEEIAFQMDKGVRRYASWAHDRPSTAGALWQLDGMHLTVTQDGASRYDWTLVRVTRTRLELTEKGGEAVTVMRRIVR